MPDILQSNYEKFYANMEGNKNVVIDELQCSKFLKSSGSIFFTHICFVNMHFVEFNFPASSFRNLTVKSIFTVLSQYQAFQLAFLETIIKLIFRTDIVRIWSVSNSSQPIKALNPRLSFGSCFSIDRTTDCMLPGI